MIFKDEKELLDIIASFDISLQQKRDLIRLVKKAYDLRNQEVIKAFDDLMDQLEKDIKRLEEADDQIRDTLTQEVERAVERDIELQNNIDREATIREQQDELIKDLIEHLKEHSDEKDKEILDAFGDAKDQWREKFTELNDALEKEINRAIGKEGELQSNINKERQRAETKENELESSLQGEIDRATAKEKELKEYTDQSVGVEKQRAITRENELEDMIAKETARAEGEEARLGEEISREVQRAKDAEQSLRDDFTTEQQKDKQERDRIERKLDDEIYRSVEEDKKHDLSILKEEARAKAEEAEIRSELQKETERAKGVEDQLTADLSSEVHRATDREDDLEGMINAERERAEGKEKDLTGLIEAETDRATKREDEIESNLNQEIENAQEREQQVLADSKAYTDQKDSKVRQDFKSADDKLKEELQETHDTLHSEIEAEANRADAEEKRLAELIQEETDRATTREDDLEGMINAETQRATDAESSLQGAIDKEKTRATERENSIEQSLNQFKTETNTTLTEIQQNATDNLDEAKRYTDSKVADLVDSSPEALDTLKELADALGGDPNFSATVLGKIGENKSAIEKEAARADAAEKDLQKKLNDHITADDAAHQKLTEDLATEATERKADVKTLTENLASEKSRSETKDAAHDKSISDLTTNLDAAKKDLSGKIDTVQSNLNTTNTNLEKEAATARAAEAANKKATETNAAAIEQLQSDKLDKADVPVITVSSTGSGYISNVAVNATNKHQLDITKTALPTALKNPNALTFSGAVTGSYDGSSAVTINVPNVTATVTGTGNVVTNVTASAHGITATKGITALTSVPEATTSSTGGIKLFNAKGTADVTIADKNYDVKLDKSGKAYVNVPWSNTTYDLSPYAKKTEIGNATLTIKQGGTSKGTFTANASSNVTIELTDNNTTYSAGSGLSLSGTTFAVKTGATSSGKDYAVKPNTDGNLIVNVPWTDTNTTYGNATTSTAGLMSATDKAKLDAIASGANNYSLPTATTTTLGGVKLGSTATTAIGSKVYGVHATSGGQLAVSVPWTDTNTTYTFSNKAATLAWNTATTIATVGGTDITVKLPANPNTNTTYTFANGTAGNFTVTPSGGSAQTVSVGKPSTAGTADKVAKSLKAGSKTYNGSADVTILASDLDAPTKTETFINYRGIVPTEYIDLTTYTAGATGFTGPYPSGAYTISRSSYSELFLSFNCTRGSTTALEFKSSYSNLDPLYVRKVIDGNKISGPWQRLAFYDDLNWNNITNKPTIPTIPNLSTEAAGASSGYVSGISVSGHKITVTKTAMPSIPSIPNLSGGSAAESGKYVSGVTVSGHTVTVTKANLPATVDAYTKGESDNKYQTKGTTRWNPYSIIDDYNAVPAVNGVFGVSGNVANGPGPKYGSVLQWSNVTNPTPGIPQHWINQLTAPTNDNLYFRQRINNGAWISWKKLAFSDEIPSLSGYATETWVTNKGYTTNKGTVTSVNGTGASGSNITVTGGAITTSGTLTVGVASGYSIPTTAKQSNWDTAYGWGNHASAGYLKSHQTIPSISITNSGTGNGVASITANGHTVTVNKTNFLTSHQSLSGYATESWVSSNFNKYSLPVAQNSTLGGIKTGKHYTGAVSGFTAASGTTAPSINSVSTTSGRYYAVETDSNGLAFVNVPWVNTTYTIPTIPSITVSTSGSGKGISSITASNHTITVNKTSIDWSDITSKPTIPSAYTLPTASSTTKGGIKVGTGLSISSEVLSVQYGTTSGTACAGNDSRLTDSRPASDVYSWAKQSTMPVATSTTIGGIKIGYSENEKRYAVKLDSSDKAYVEVPWVAPRSYSAGTGLSLSRDTFNLNEATSSTIGGVLVNGITQTVDNNSPTSTANRTYAVQKDSKGYLVVNVPWTSGSGGITSISSSTSGSGNVVTAVSASGSTVKVTKGNVLASVTQPDIAFLADAIPVVRSINYSGTAVTYTQRDISTDFIRQDTVKKIEVVSALPTTQTTGTLYLVFES